jgi:hypothetical protein
MAAFRLPDISHLSEACELPVQRLARYRSIWEASRLPVVHNSCGSLQTHRRVINGAYEIGERHLPSSLGA